MDPQSQMQRICTLQHKMENNRRRIRIIALLIYMLMLKVGKMLLDNKEIPQIQHLMRIQSTKQCSNK
jgi:hypothetical protein